MGGHHACESTLHRLIGTEIPVLWLPAAHPAGEPGQKGPDATGSDRFMRSCPGAGAGFVTSQDTSLQLQWVDDIAALRTLMGEWEELAERTQADVYMLPGWVSVWWDHFGRGRQLACMVLRNEGRLVGLLPFTIERLWIGPIPMRLARLAGTDPHCIVFQVPVEAEFAEFAWREALTHLLDEFHCTAVSFTPLSDRATHLNLLRDVMKQSDDLVFDLFRDGNHIVFDLADNFEEWLINLSRGARKKFRRDEKRINDVYKISETELAPSEEDFAEFAAFHERQWQAVGRGGHFVDWPNSLTFYCELADQNSSERFMRLYSVCDDQDALVTRFGLIAGGRVHMRLPARRIDADANRVAVGKVSLLMTIRKLIEAGISLIEDGRGDYDYKISCGGISVPVWRALISRNTTYRKLQMRLLLAWADLLNLVYYRIWFHKIAPRLRRLTGARPRPLWRGWIRTRV